MNLEEVIGCSGLVNCPTGCSLRHKHIDFDLTFLELLKSVIILYVPFSENYVKLFGYRAKGHFMS